MHKQTNSHIHHDRSDEAKLMTPGGDTPQRWYVQSNTITQFGFVPLKVCLGSITVIEVSLFHTEVTTMIGIANSGEGQ